MTWQFTPTALLFFVSAAIAFGLAIYVWRLQADRSVALIAGICFSGIWAIGTGLEMLAVELSWKLIFVRYIMYLGITGTICCWGLFTIVYGNYQHLLNRYTVALLAVIPVVTYLLVLTLPQHQLFYGEYWITEVNGLLLLDKVYGPAFWFWAVYSYSVILGGAIILIRAVVRFPELYQGQAAMLVVGVLIPLVANILFLAGFSPLGPADPSALMIIISFGLFTVGIFRYRLFDVVPVAHDLVFQGVRSGVVILDNQGRIIEINPAAEQILHCGKNEVIGRPILAAFPEHEALLRQFQEVHEVKTEITLTQPEQASYELQIMPLHDRRSKAAGRIILLYDITERNRALAERDKLIRELDAYAHTVAHDLKSPLAATIGFIDLVETYQPEKIPEDLRQPLAAIARNSYKMTSIVDELLTLASVRNMDQIEIRPLEMAPLVDGALERLSRPISAARAEIIKPDAWPAAVGYPPWVEEVWANYISNAVKYGGQPPRIELGAERLPAATYPPQIRFWVRDNGPGLTPEQADRLFREFSRLEQHHDLQGHGLGLSIVQRIVDKLGGAAGVDSRPGQGSTFYFTLPAS